MKRISILGVTGSIGTSALDLIARNRDSFSCIAFTANENVEALAVAARTCHAKLAVIANEAHYEVLKTHLSGSGIEVAAGAEAIENAAAMEADFVLSAIVGAAGLRPTLSAIKQGRTVGLANKESLVCAGDLMTETVKASGARLLPVDSEHNAIFQVFDFDRPETIAKIILTASGGPFREWSLEAMRSATPAQAVKHPNWSMGAKISVDSATLMNKGLELIEAYHLFPVNVDQLDVIIHPQSVVHSMVEYIDGSVLAQLGSPDMRTPIAYAMAWPERMAAPVPRLNLADVAKLEFLKPDMVRFPALGLAWEALKAGGAAPATLNAANEVAVAAFLDGRIGFLDIASIVSDTLDKIKFASILTVEDVMIVDENARVHATDLVKRKH